MATNKDILKKLDCVENKLMNGELEEIHETVKEIKEVLLDPEDGIIVRVNKNTYWRKQINIQEIEELKSFKSMQYILLRYNVIEDFLLKIEIHKRSKILLFFFAYPHCCWSLYYLPSLLIIPIYSILQWRKSFLK